MKTIMEFKLDVAVVQHIEIPEGSKILTAQERQGQISLWVIVDLLVPTERRTIEILGTGGRKNGFNGQYIETVQLGDYVYHVFDLGKA